MALELFLILWIPVTSQVALIFKMRKRNLRRWQLPLFELREYAFFFWLLTSNFLAEWYAYGNQCQHCLFLLIYLNQPFGIWSYFWLVFCSWVAFIGPALYIQGQPNFSICFCTYICICTCIFGLYFLAGGMHRANIIQSRTTQFGKVFVFSADSMWATLVTNSKKNPHHTKIWFL